MAVASLEIAITTQANEAVASLEKLAKSLRSLNRTLADTHTTKAGKSITSITDKMIAFSGAIETIDVDRLNAIADAMERISAAKGAGKAFSSSSVAGASTSGTTETSTAETQTGGVEAAESEAEASTERFSSFMNTMVRGTAEGIGQIFRDLAGVIRTTLCGALKAAGTLGKVAFNSMTSGIRKATSGAIGLVKQFKRMFMMRLMRQAIMKVLEGFTEGLKNAVEYSRAHGGDLAKTMDGLATSTNTMKNQLGAAFGGLIQYVEPILTSLINMITKVANAITQLFAALNGKSTFLSAANQAKKYGDAAKSGSKATKEWKNQLLGFDEINRLSDNNSSGGGGGSGSGAGGAYQETEIGGFFKKLKELAASGEWYKLGETIADKINDLVANVDFRELGNKLGEKIQNGISVALGFLQNLDVYSIGYNLGEFITGLMEDINPEDVGALLAQKFKKMIEFAAGLALNFKENGGTWGEWFGGVVNGFFEEFDFAQIGDAVKDFTEGLVDFVSEFCKSVDWSGVINGISEGIGSVIGGLASALWDKLIKPAWDDLVTWWHDNAVEDGEFTITGLLNGIWEKIKDIGTWIKDHIFKPFINGFKDAFGIHSPSTEMADMGDNLIQGLWKGIKDAWSGFWTNVKGKWEEFKNWWKNLSLPNFKFKTPHLNLGSKQATGWIASALEFFGLPATLPTLSVDWYAKGGVVDGAHLIGAGEAGKEAIVPLENNTGWMDGVADRLAEKLGMSMTSGEKENRVYVYLDGKQISDSVTRHQRQTARAMGV